MQTIQSGDRVVGVTADGETIEVYTVAKVLADAVQVEGTSGRLSKAGLRVYEENAVNKIAEKENQLKVLKREIRRLYESLSPVA
ncbi:MAG: hypothetical protein RDU20_13085 [Desulfomonilaceae bacterium]|nr:hypothetical protein [Desulfomonilaceae bacterium]